MARIKTAPRTEEVYSTLKERIAAGMYAGTGLLPTETVLAEELGVSRKTLRSALSRLALENSVVRVKGQGTFVRTPEPGDMKLLVIMRNTEDITDPGRYILPGIREEAAATHVTVETCTDLSLALWPQEETLARIKEKNYAGILSFHAGYNGDEPTIELLRKTGLPVLLVHAMRSDAENTGFAVMGTDYPRLIRDGLLYLAGKGHRRISYLSFHEHRIGRAEYFALLRELGLDGAPELRAEISSFNDADRILKEIGEFFDSLRKLPTAVFCFSDFFAVCLYKYLKKKHIAIPDDVAVLSIGGLIGCDFLTPPLSTVDFNCHEIGRQAVRTILEMKQKKELSLPFMVTPHYVVERESTQKKGVPRK